MRRTCKKRANSRARTVRRAPFIRRFLVGLTLAMIGTGGISVVTMTHCHGKATTQVEAKFARHGPFGTAARFSADLSDEFELTVTFTASGICRAVSSINLEGGREPRARSRRLPAPPKKGSLGRKE